MLMFFVLSSIYYFPLYDFCDIVYFKNNVFIFSVEPLVNGADVSADTRICPVFLNINTKAVHTWFFFNYGDFSISAYLNRYSSVKSFAVLTFKNLSPCWYYKFFSLYSLHFIFLLPKLYTEYLPIFNMYRRFIFMRVGVYIAPLFYIRTRNNSNNTMSSIYINFFNLLIIVQNLFQNSFSQQSIKLLNYSELRSALLFVSEDVVSDVFSGLQPLHTQFSSADSTVSLLLNKLILFSTHLLANSFIFFSVADLANLHVELNLIILKFVKTVSSLLRIYVRKVPRRFFKFAPVFKARMYTKFRYRFLTWGKRRLSRSWVYKRDPVCVKKRNIRMTTRVTNFLSILYFLFLVKGGFQIFETQSTQSEYLFFTKFFFNLSVDFLFDFDNFASWYAFCTHRYAFLTTWLSYAYSDVFERNKTSLSNLEKCVLRFFFENKSNSDAALIIKKTPPHIRFIKKKIYKLTSKRFKFFKIKRVLFL